METSFILVVTSVYRTNQQSISVGEYNIPPHSVILFDLMQPQLDPELWNNPEDFNPDRWTTANQDGYIPFGAGLFRYLIHFLLIHSLFF